MIETVTASIIKAPVVIATVIVLIDTATESLIAAVVVITTLTESIDAVANVNASVGAAAEYHALGRANHA